jgi:hypothetical protein
MEMCGGAKVIESLNNKEQKGDIYQAEREPPLNALR